MSTSYEKQCIFENNIFSLSKINVHKFSFEIVDLFCEIHEKQCFCYRLIVLFRTIMIMFNDTQIFSNFRQNTFNNDKFFVFENIEHDIIVQFVFIIQIDYSIS